MKYILLLLVTIFSFDINLMAQNNYNEFENNKSIQNYMLLDSTEFNSIVNNKNIMKELYISVKDSIQPEVISRRIRLFLNKTYNEKQLLLTLQMDRQLNGTSGTFELDTTLKVNKVMHFKSVDEYLVFKKKLDSSFFGNFKIKDTIIKKKTKN